MSASRIVLLRHGQTDFNLQRRFQGRIDMPLNEAGRGQAAGAAGVLVSRLCEPSAEVGMFASAPRRSYDDGGVRLVSSPLGRALDTARIVARVFEIAQEPQASRQYRASGESEEAQVERSEVVGARVREAVLEAAGDCGGDQSLIVVSHGAAIARGIVSLLGLDPAVFNGLRGVDNCHWSELVPVGESSAKSAARCGWRLASHNIGSREDILGA